jgi:hypothetical protein
MYDEEMAVASRKMIMVCVLVHLCMARIFFSNWPYQDESTDKASCNFLTCEAPPSGWTDDQQRVISVYTTTGILVFVFGIITVVAKSFKRNLVRLFCSKVDEVGEASAINVRRERSEREKDRAAGLHQRPQYFVRAERAGVAAGERPSSLLLMRDRSGQE